MTSYEPPPGVPVHCCACGESFDVPDDPHARYPLDNGICAGCWKLIRRPNHAIVAENERLRERLALLRATLLEIVNATTRVTSADGEWDERVYDFRARHVAAVALSDDENSAR